MRLVCDGFLSRRDDVPFEVIGATMTVRKWSCISEAKPRRKYPDRRVAKRILCVPHDAALDSRPNGVAG
jgi:hypothetical protein